MIFRRRSTGPASTLVRRRRGIGLAALAAFVSIIAVPARAQADEWGPVVAPDVLFYTDNSTLTYCFTQGFDPFRAVGDYAMSTIDSTTDLVSQFPTTPQNCEFRETDIWWLNFNLPAGVRGRAVCQWVASWDDTLCKSDDLQIDIAEIDIGNFDWEDRRKTACHELGHAVGLQHGTSSGAGSCMILGEIPNTNLQYRRYSSHHINSHINVRY